MKRAVRVFRLQPGEAMIIFAEKKSGKLYCHKLISGNTRYRKETMDCIHKGNGYVYGYNF